MAIFMQSARYKAELMIGAVSLDFKTISKFRLQEMLSQYQQLLLETSFLLFELESIHQYQY